MPKYNDFELDVQTTKLNEENMGSVASMDVSRHNSCAGHCGTSVISLGFMKCCPNSTRTQI